MKSIKPNSTDQTPSGLTVFLGGTIEMGNSLDWQKEVQKHFGTWDITFFNPRRDEWNPDWEQRQSSPQFNLQVNWELNKLEIANAIFMYFQPDTNSPISLMELGLFAGSNKMIVVCPDGYWRKGNVEIVCTRYSIPIFNTMEEGLGALTSKIIQLRTWD